MENTECNSVNIDRKGSIRRRNKTIEPAMSSKLIKVGAKGEQAIKDWPVLMSYLYIKYKIYLFRICLGHTHTHRRTCVLN